MILELWEAFFHQKLWIFKKNQYENQIFFPTGKLLRESNFQVFYKESTTQSFKVGKNMNDELRIGISLYDPRLRRVSD